MLLTIAIVGTVIGLVTTIGCLHRKKAPEMVAAASFFFGINFANLTWLFTKGI
jgi:hypothetical protein